MGDCTLCGITPQACSAPLSNCTLYNRIALDEDEVLGDCTLCNQFSGSPPFRRLGLDSIVQNAIDTLLAVATLLAVDTLIFGRYLSLHNT